MVTYINSYSKPGAVFATAEEAREDKARLFPPELKQSVDDCFNNMLAAGILLEPVGVTWDQDNFILNMIKKVTSVEAYEGAVTFNRDEVGRYSEDAGWRFLGNYTE